MMNNKLALSFKATGVEFHVIKIKYPARKYGEMLKNVKKISC